MSLINQTRVEYNRFLRLDALVISLRGRHVVSPCHQCFISKKGKVRIIYAKDIKIRIQDVNFKSSFYAAFCYASIFLRSFVRSFIHSFIHCLVSSNLERFALTMLTLFTTFILLISIPSILVNATTLQPRALGASTPLTSKSKLCNILTYGAVADGKTDISTAIATAFSQCVKGHPATLYIPAGSYSLAKGVTLNGASGWALRLDGLITLTQNGAFNGNAFVIENGNDIEVYSSNNQGAINGQGYLTRKSKGTQNARLLRFIAVSNLSVHNLILVDSPTFHLIFNGVSNLDAYYLTIRGPDIGGTDGIDLICTSNCHIHDFEVTNRDECVSVKSPSANVLIENAYCNHSGGMSIGSLTADITSASQAAAVENITMRNVYSYKSTQMLMIKTFPGGNGAEGYVRDSTFEGFWS